MVVVMAIIALLAALVTPAMSGLLGATGLTAAGNKVTQMASQARQLAMTRNTVTALALLGDVGTPGDYRSLAVLEYDSGAGWKLAGAWEQLPAGVLVDYTAPAVCTFVSLSEGKLPFAQSAPNAGTLPFDYDGTPLSGTTCSLRVFLPNGGLHDSENPARIRLVEGVKEDDGILYRSPSPAGVPANYYDISLIGATGIAKVSRP